MSWLFRRLSKSKVNQNTKNYIKGINTQKKKSDEKWSRILETEKQMHKSQIKELSDLFHEKHEASKDAIIALRGGFSQQIKEIEEYYNNQIAVIRKEHDRQVTEINAANEKRINGIKKEFDIYKEQLDAEYRSKAYELEQKISQAINERERWEVENDYLDEISEEMVTSMSRVKENAEAILQKAAQLIGPNKEDFQKLRRTIRRNQKRVEEDSNKGTRTKIKRKRITTMQ